MTRLRFLSAAAASLLLLPTLALANGDEELNESFVFDGVGVGVTSQGVGTASRDGGSGSGTIEITEVPVGATILASYLYWSNTGSSGGDDTATLDGNPVTGSLIGTGGGTCWSHSETYGYRL
ncbi:MAG: hypothetical protein GY898_10605, partial [Proteobacteria bacterium]|nr:hypothetical protein [Pseudomonadota bacterium]